jgi:hypothetical protein
MKALTPIQVSPSKWFGFVFLFGFAVILLVFLALWPYVHVPLTDNEGVYAYIGRSLLSGAKLYQDIWDHKPPLLFLHFLILAKLGGNEEILLHLYAGVIHCVNVTLLFWVGKKWLGNKSWWCSLTYILLILPPFFQCWPPQAELLMEPFLLIALLLLDKKASWRWLLLGALLVCGFFTKQSFLFYLPLFFLGNALVGPLEVVYFFVGMDVLVLLVVLPFLAEGRLDQLWYATWDFNREYVANGWAWFSHHPEFRQGLMLWIVKMLEVYGLFFLAFFYFVWDTFRQPNKGKYAKQDILLILWFLLSFAMVAVSGYFFPYYSIVFLLPLSVLAPVVLLKLCQNHLRLSWLLVVLAVTGPLVSWGTVWASGDGALAWSGYLKSHNESAKETGCYLRSIAKPGDKLFAWTMEPQIYIYSGLSALPYLKDPLVNHLLVMPDELNRTKEEFDKNPPRFVVISYYDQVNDPPAWLIDELQDRWLSINPKEKIKIFILR